MAASNQNIRVCARFRPQFPHETEQGGVPCVQFLENKAALINQGNRRKIQFAFDRVFGPQCDQKTVYEETVGHMVDEVLHGYNCTILAYGQTGSGKTYTMQGTETARGLMPRLMKTLFEKIRDFPGDQSPGDVSFSVDLSYVEIYRGKIRDLLEENSKKRKQQKLKIRHDLSSTGSGGVYLEGAVEKAVCDHEEIMYWIECGAGNREIKTTAMNPESSRSHGVVIIILKAVAKNGSQRTAKLMMVDLAGSEAAKKTGATGDTLKEAQAINGDLQALGAIMNQLTSRKGTNPSYRSSKLTHLLSDSLGGNCKTTLIVCASESSYNVIETVSTLRFGKSAKKVKNKAKVNEEKSVTEYKQEIERLKKKVGSQQSIIAALKNDVNRALAGKITDLSDCMYKRIERGEKVALAKDEEKEETDEHRRSPSNQSLDSLASTDSKVSNFDNPLSDSGTSSKNLISHQRTLTNTSLGSLGENELIVSKDQYEQFCEALERLGEIDQVRKDFIELKTENQTFRDKLVDKQAEVDEVELKMEKESKKWTEKKISLRYKNETLQRKNASLRERLRLASQSFESTLYDMEKSHAAKLDTVRAEEKERVESFISEAREAFVNDSRFNSDPNTSLESQEQRLKFLSSENMQLRQVFQERNQEYVDWKLKAFKLEQGREALKRKVLFQHNELKLLAEAKKDAADIHYQNISSLERELKIKRKENSNLKKKIVQLEACIDDEAAWIGKTTQVIRGQFRNMNMRIRPKKYGGMNILEQEIPQFNHGRAPSNVFTPMYTPDPAHVYRQPSIDFLHNTFTPPVAFQTPQGIFQGYEQYQNPNMQNFHF